MEDRGRGGFIDKTGTIAIPLCFDAVGDFSEGLARFERDQKWGYLDKTGTVVIEPTFQWAQEFSEGLARVQVSGSQLGIDSKWGFIDKTGAVVIDERKDPSFGEHSNIGSDSAESAFHDGLALVDVGGKKGYIDKTGKVVIAPQFTYAYPFAEGLAAATSRPPVMMAGAISTRQVDGWLSQNLSEQAHSRVDWPRSVGPGTAAMLTCMGRWFCNPESRRAKPIARRYGVTS